MDDRRVGLIIRALRRRRGWHQSDLAAASNLSQPAVSLLERGHLDSLSLRRIRRILAALDARGEFDIRWRGSAVEVTYSIYGERGSIDVLGFHRPTGSLVVIEVKTELTSIEETLRRHDEKVRLAHRIAQERFGWAAATTSRLLVLPDKAAARRKVLRHTQVLDAVLPARNVAIRHWLDSPAQPIRGRWFLAIIRPGSTRPGLDGPDRVQRSSHPSNPADSRTDPEPRH